MNDEYGNAKEALDEDWAMISPNLQAAKPAESAPEIYAKPPTDSADEIITLAGGGKSETEEKRDEWKMPEPIFRVSSGKTPEKPKNAAPKNDLPFDKPIIVENAPKTAPVQPQPNISREFIVNQTVEKTSAKDDAKSFNMILVVLGFAAIIIFAVAFLVAVYFLFFYRPEA